VKRTRGERGTPSGELPERCWTVIEKEESQSLEKREIRRESF